MRAHAAHATAAALSLAGAAHAQTAVFSNGEFATGPTLSSGAPAPAGSLWSEVQNGNTSLGFVAERYADNFTLAAPAALQSVDVFAFVSNWQGGNSPFTAATLRIWNGKPGQAGAAVIFGNTTTNRLLSSTVLDVYRVRYQESALTRRVWSIRLSLNTTLPAGTYWADWGLNGVGTVVPVTIPGQLGKPGADAIYFTPAIGFWRDLEDGTSHIHQDLPFVLNGGATAGGCLPNCDNSTAVPFLNVADFSCFLASYAAGCPSPAPCYPNCDGSTAVPFLNVADFSCFLASYAAGCSAP